MSIRLGAAAWLHNRYWQQHLPDGMVSWRFLCSAGDPLIRQHRRMAFAARGRRVPPALWRPLQWLLWGRWLLWHAWRDSWRIVRYRGAEVVAGEGIGRVRQFLAVLNLALAHTVPPWQAYDYRLYRPERRRLLWTYVFDHEANSYHAWNCDSRADWLAGSALLGDKLECERQLSGLGLPVVKTLALVPRGGGADFRSLLAAGQRLFCKPRRGARGEHAFMLDAGGAAGALRMRELAGTWIAPDAVATCVAARLDVGDFLLQPCLQNHGQIADLTELDFAITVRLITVRQDGKISLLAAMASIPVESPAGEVTLRFLGVALDDGGLSALPDDAVDGDERPAQEVLHARLGQRSLPDWPAACRIAAAAHERLCPSLRGIAWDFVFTPDGPILLEGNGGWSLSVPQLINGGFLAPPAKAPTTT
jgi:hypothetical protein